MKVMSMPRFSGRGQVTPGLENQLPVNSYAVMTTEQYDADRQLQQTRFQLIQVDSFQPSNGKVMMKDTTLAGHGWEAFPMEAAIGGDQTVTDDNSDIMLYRVAGTNTELQIARLGEFTTNQGDTFSVQRTDGNGKPLLASLSSNHPGERRVHFQPWDDFKQRLAALVAEGTPSGFSLTLPGDSTS